MRRWYIPLIVGLMVTGATALGFLMWRNKVSVSSALQEGNNRLRGTARSVWGRVAKAANKLSHTEKNPNEST